MFCKQQQYTSTQNNPSAIPGVLKARLLTSGSLIFGILAAGIFMEYQMGAGFLKLSCLCSVCFGIRFLILFSIIYCRKYEVQGTEKKLGIDCQGKERRGKTDSDFVTA